MAKGEQGGFAENIALLSVFSAAMAFAEAIAGVYVRRLLPLKNWQAEVSDYASMTKFLEFHHILWTEQARETAVLIILVAVAVMAGSHIRQRAGAFLWIGGIWNILYYVFLYVLIKWPPSLAAWDAHLVIPRPWMAPVYISVIVSLAMLMVAVPLLKSDGKAKSKPAAKSREKAAR